MSDKILTLNDLGRVIRQERMARKIRPSAIAQHSGKSRDVLHRLETGQDITISSLLSILRAMNMCVKIAPAGMPTMEEMAARFADDDEGE